MRENQGEEVVENEPTTVTAAEPALRPVQVYVVAAICLTAGLCAGYALRSSPAHTAAAPVQTAAMHPSVAAPGITSPRRMPTLQEMKQMADKQATPVLEKLKSNPTDSKSLAQAGAIYHTTHQFKEAAAFYSKAVDADPKNVALRTRLASSLYRSGDVDGAIAQLNQGLKYEPKDANALFDLGMIRLQGKRDGKGALAAWQKLLKSNPELSPARKDMVQKLMAEVLTSLGNQRQQQGARTDDGPKASAD